MLHMFPALCGYREPDTRIAIGYGYQVASFERVG
jgi:hypothetical protein